MLSVGFEPVTSDFERAKTVHALDCTAFLTVVYKICADYLRHFCVCVFSHKFTWTSEWIVTKCYDGRLNRIYRWDTVLVIKEQRFRTHEDPQAFHALLELNSYHSEKVWKNICREKWNTYFISRISFSVSLTAFKQINRKGANAPHFLWYAFVSERGVLKKDKRMRKRR
jgi:hypothetical protein